MESQNLNSLTKIAEFIGGEVGFDNGVEIRVLASAESNQTHGICFAESDKFLELARISEVGAVIVPAGTLEYPKPFIRHPQPRLAFLKLLQAFERPLLQADGVHPTAVIESGASVHPTASIGAMAFIHASSTIAENVIVMPFAYVGPGCVVGEGSILMPHSVLVQDVWIGKNCEIGPGSVIGHAGFGYVWDGSRQLKIPQVGGVSLGDHVDVGANTTIDRATTDATVIEAGNKFDNLVQVAHNAHIGPHGVFASQVGIAGSTKIGERATAGGQSGYGDHLVIADGVTIAGRTAVLGSIPEPGFYGGTPAVPLRDYRRIVAVNNDLPDLLKRLRAVERELKAMKESHDL